MRLLARGLLILWLGVVAAPASAGAAEVAFGRYHALVIGINSYQHLPDLKTAVNDAGAVHDMLRREYGYSSTLLLNPDRDALVGALEKLRAELTAQDNLLIYYAGHGYLDRLTGEGFWQPIDADEDSQVNWVAVSTVTRMLKASPAKHALVVADSCYSGTLTRDAPAMLKTGAERLTELKRIAAKRARKALTSGGLEPVADGGGDGHSPFTRAFLQALRGNTEVVDGYQLYRAVRQRVILNAEQTPQYSDIRFAGDEGGDYLFVPVAADLSLSATAETDAPQTAGTSMEVVFWQSIQDSRNAADFEAYLEAYPDGVFAALARNRVAELTQLAAVVPKEPAPPAPKLTPVESAYIALKNSNVRAAPRVGSAKVTVLAKGSEVQVPGATEDGQWLQVERDGRVLGFVFAPLLQERSAWQAARAAKEQEDAAAKQRAADAAAQQTALEDEARRKKVEDALRRQNEKTLKKQRAEEAEAERIARLKAEEAGRARRQQSGGAGRGWIGAQVTTLSEKMAAEVEMPGWQGAIVTAVVPNSPAAAAGIRRRDVILTFDNVLVRDTKLFVHLVSESQIGRDVPVVIRRGPQTIMTKVRIGRYDSTARQTPAAPGGGDAAAIHAFIGRNEKLFLDRLYTYAQKNRMFAVDDNPKNDFRPQSLVRYEVAHLEGDLYTVTVGIRAVAKGLRTDLTRNLIVGWRPNAGMDSLVITGHR